MSVHLIRAPLFFTIIHRPFTLESLLWLSKENSIMVTDTLNIQRLFASWKSQWARRGVGIQRTRSTISLLLPARVRSPQKRDSLSLFLSTSGEHSRVSWQLYARRKSLSSIFYSIRPGGDYSVHAWGSAWPSSRPPVSPLSLSVERNQGPPPFESKPPQMCSKIRRARQIGKNQTRLCRDLSIAWSIQAKIN